MALPLIPILAAAAPALIARIAGEGEDGPLAAAAQAAVREIAGTVPRTPEEEAALLARLREDAVAMGELKARLAEIQMAEAEAILADRADARARDLSLQVETGRRNARADVMLIAAFACVLGIAGVMFLLSRAPGAEGSPLVNTMVGFLTGVGGMFARNIGTAFDFEFGSSRSSREKTGRLAGLAERAGGAASAASPIGAPHPGARAAGAALGAGARDALSVFRRRLAE